MGWVTPVKDFLNVFPPPENVERACVGGDEMEIIRKFNKKKTMPKKKK